MVNKKAGYIIAVIGLLILAVGLVNEARDFVQNTLKLNLQNIPDIAIIVAGVIIIAVGAFLATKSSSHDSRHREIPIYKGKHVVGYRRH